MLSLDAASRPTAKQARAPPPCALAVMCIRCVRRQLNAQCRRRTSTRGYHSESAAVATPTRRRRGHPSQQRRQRPTGISARAVRRGARARAAVNIQWTSRRTRWRCFLRRRLGGRRLPTWTRAVGSRTSRPVRPYRHQCEEHDKRPPTRQSAAIVYSLCVTRKSYKKNCISCATAANLLFKETLATHMLHRISITSTLQQRPPRLLRLLLHHPLTRTR